jgi:hypothetical protein
VLAVVPVALLLHNLEEALTIGAALSRMQAKVSALLGRAVALPSERQFDLDLVLITAFGFVLLLAARWWSGAGWALVALQAVMAVNVLVHVGAAVLMGDYVPSSYRFPLTAFSRGPRRRSTGTWSMTSSTPMSTRSSRPRGAS